MLLLDNVYVYPVHAVNMAISVLYDYTYRMEDCYATLSVIWSLVSMLVWQQCIMHMDGTMICPLHEAVVL